eukprot:CAMPEP_0183302072 /NCGR_PEP_ID=MMETSP0160_2-20130417/7987_1 /TAXON_ID=2839 ORGANISM="Odontella Sinensis, Strain Grunow 1884" /NCGR_SAMPLE_ID=MMETSP0160_2 /ASSEMBLY_ACC=CAM_ASM_000250 /LENGTH=397 /DNA_ID=CAMNT_0025464797 /DNA_START=72 /DNA_END=1265 /DNA_ORIENTATION=-
MSTITSSVELTSPGPQSWTEEQRRDLKGGDLLDVLDPYRVWCKARITAVRNNDNEEGGVFPPPQVQITYLGWGRRWDEWIERASARLQPYGKRTGSLWTGGPDHPAPGGFSAPYDWSARLGSSESKWAARKRAAAMGRTRRRDRARGASRRRRCLPELNVSEDRYEQDDIWYDEDGYPGWTYAFKLYNDGDCLFPLEDDVHSNDSSWVTGDFCGSDLPLVAGGFDFCSSDVPSEASKFDVVSLDGSFTSATEPIKPSMGSEWEMISSAGVSSSFQLKTSAPYRLALLKGSHTAQQTENNTGTTIRQCDQLLGAVERNEPGTETRDADGDQIEENWMEGLRDQVKNTVGGRINCRFKGNVKKERKEGEGKNPRRRKESWGRMKRNYRKCGAKCLMRAW